MGEIDLNCSTYLARSNHRRWWPRGEYDQHYIYAQPWKTHRSVYHSWSVYTGGSVCMCVNVHKCSRI